MNAKASNMLERYLGIHQKNILEMRYGFQGYYDNYQFDL